MNVAREKGSDMPERRAGSSLAAARERYLEVAKNPQHVRPLVVASWQRSMEYEVNTSALDAPYLENPNLDIPLVRAALPILDRLLEQLAGDRAARWECPSARRTGSPSRSRS